MYVYVCLPSSIMSLRVCMCVCLPSSTMSLCVCMRVPASHHRAQRAERLELVPWRHRDVVTYICLYVCALPPPRRAQRAERLKVVRWRHRDLPQSVADACSPQELEVRFDRFDLQNDRFDLQNDRFDLQNDRFDLQNGRFDRQPQSWLLKVRRGCDAVNGGTV